MITAVSGHRNLGSAETSQWVANELTKTTAAVRITRGLTCLAIGADQLFAEVLLTHQIGYTAVIPCALYEDSFSPEELVGYRRLLQQAKDQYLLPTFNEPSDPAYMAAGKYIVENCELLIAVWNGQPAKGLGGTGDVVAYALSRRIPVLHINPVSREVRDVQS